MDSFPNSKQEEIDVNQDLTLESLAGAPNYQNWLADLAFPDLGKNPLEIGSGNGDYAEIWLNNGCQNITLQEIDLTRIQKLRDRFKGDKRVSVISDTETATYSNKYSSCVSFNVLEHVEDDQNLVEQMVRMVAPGGTVFILVPAFPFAYSSFDRSIGHYRRYTKNSLHSVMSSAGLESVHIRYLNPAGLVAWFFLMKLMKRSPKSGTALTIWDKTVVPFSAKIEQKVRAPFGQSCVGVGTVPRI